MDWLRAVTEAALAVETVPSLDLAEIGEVVTRSLFLNPRRKLEHAVVLQGNVCRSKSPTAEEAGYDHARGKRKCTDE